MGMLQIRQVAKKFLGPVIIILVLAMAAGLFFIGPSAFGGNQADSYAYKGPSAKVNGEKLKDADFNKALNQMLQQYGAMGASESLIRNMVLEGLVQQTAMEQEIKKVSGKLRVSGADANKLIKKAFPTEEELQGFLEQRQIDKAELKKLAIKQLQYQRFFALKAKQFGITVSQAEVKKALKDSTKPIHSDTEALKLANEVYQKSTTGTDFAKLAKEYSEDPGSRDKDGKYGPMPLAQFKEQMDKDFVAGALALKVGQVSKPVKTQFGYHVIKLAELSKDQITIQHVLITINDIPKPSANEAKEQYREMEESLLGQKVSASPKYKDWESSVLKKANENLEVLDPGLRAYRLKQQGKFKEASQAYEKALQRNYYKNKAEFYIEASECYVKQNMGDEAVKLLKKLPVESQNNLNYQVALATAYKTANKMTQAKSVLAKYCSANQDDRSVQEKLKQVFTDFKMTDMVAKVDQNIAMIDKKEKEQATTATQNLAEKYQQPQVSASPAPTPAK